MGIPTQIQNLPEIKDIAAGASHFVLLSRRHDENIFVFGANVNRQLGISHTNYITTPTLLPECPKGIVTVKCGFHFTILIDMFGVYYALGRNGDCELGIGDHVQREEPTPVSGKILNAFPGGHHSLCITENGEVWGFGWNRYGQLGTPTPSPSVFRTPMILPCSSSIFCIASTAKS